jgi:hypothetical protein
MGVYFNSVMDDHLSEDAGKNRPRDGHGHASESIKKYFLTSSRFRFRVIVTQKDTSPGIVTVPSLAIYYRSNRPWSLSIIFAIPI